jgi:magnesium transporter
VITSTVITQYSGSLSSATLIAMLPMVMATGGMVGTQASALVIRALTIGDVAKATISRVLWKELRVAGFMGALLGVIALMDTVLVSMFPTEAANALIVPDPNAPSIGWVGLAIGIAMIGHVLTAALLGAITPIVVKKLRGDPAMISTPAVTAIADLTGVVIYIVTVTLMLSA